MKFIHFAILTVILLIAGGVCGDAGFVKTESALYASAAVTGLLTGFKLITSDPI